MNIYIEFGRRLASIRQNSKLSQSQIAQKLNIAQSTYAGYEKGVRKIPLEIIVQLSKILNISPTVLILGDEANIVKEYTISEQELIKKYGSKIKFASGIKPMITLKLEKQGEAGILQEVKEFLK